MWFAGNGIGDEGAKELAKSLANSTTLTALDLTGNCAPIHTHTLRRLISVSVTLTLAMTLILTLIQTPSYPNHNSNPQPFTLTLNLP